LEERRIVVIPRVLNAVDFDERVAGILRVLLNVDDIVFIDQKHLIGTFLACFLRLLLIRKLLGYRRDILVLDQIYFGVAFAFALRVNKRIIVFYVAACA